MPLRAILEDREIIAPDLDETAWAALKQSLGSSLGRLVMPCCGRAAIMRVSTRGLRHFAHKGRMSDGTRCDWAPESEDHLRAKLEILQACRIAGWGAQPEVRAENSTWRADILAWRDTPRGRSRVAFEVQLSPQTRAETEERQARYAAAGIRGCWFLRPRSTTAKFPGRNEHFRNPTAELPAFRLITPAEGGAQVAVPINSREEADRIVPLRSFVQALLTRRVRFATHSIANVSRRVRAVFVTIGCWRCGADAHFYYLDTANATSGELARAEERSSCGRLVHSESILGALTPEVVEIVEAHCRQHPDAQIHLGLIKPRHSKVWGHAYRSFGCPRCDTLFGESFLARLVSDYVQTGIPAEFPVITLDLPSSGRRSLDPHWCFPDNGDFCACTTRAPGRERD